MLDGYDDVFIFVGLGGTTGSKLSLAFAALAKGKGLRIHCFIILPFAFENRKRRNFAREALSRLERFADSKIVYDNEKALKSWDSSQSMLDFFTKTEQVVLTYLESFQWCDTE